MSLSTLLTIVVPPTNPVEAGKPQMWPNIERELGSALPEDYKNYINVFGSGYLDDFLWLFNPFSVKRTLNLLDASKIRAAAIREIKHKYPDEVPFGIFPEPGGLLAFAATSNGDCLYWVTIGKPAEWRIVVNESRGPEWDLFDMPLGDFLAGILQKRFKCELFPADFPSEHPVFVPAKIG